MMKKLWSEEHLKKVIPPSELATRASELKKRGRTIATLNGSFDLMHAGHLQIIYEASQQAEVLILALNSDRSIQQYKSIHRPIIPLKCRLEMVCALEFVDYATWFDETDPCKLLEIIQPHVHVNGSEYGLNCLESEVVKSGGGRLHLVELLPGLSTTEIIKKLAEITAKGV